uniref:Uncharacterized protein n=1 Tax=Anguilla anguilla TaxID=7936 RepID=A0A0E9VC59_ANGAN
MSLTWLNKWKTKSFV